MNSETVALIAICLALAAVTMLPINMDLRSSSDGHKRAERRERDWHGRRD